MQQKPWQHQVMVIILSALLLKIQHCAGDLAGQGGIPQAITGCSCSHTAEDSGHICRLA